MFDAMVDLDEQPVVREEDGSDARLFEQLDGLALFIDSQDIAHIDEPDLFEPNLVQDRDVESSTVLVSNCIMLAVIRHLNLIHLDEVAIVALAIRLLDRIDETSVAHLRTFRLVLIVVRLLEVDLSDMAALLFFVDLHHEGVSIVIDDADGYDLHLRLHCLVYCHMSE